MIKALIISKIYSGIFISYSTYYKYVIYKLFIYKRVLRLLGYEFNPYSCPGNRHRFYHFPQRVPVAQLGKDTWGQNLKQVPLAAKGSRNTPS